MADEKSSLALQLGEQRGQLNSLQKEILKLKVFSNLPTQQNYQNTDRHKKHVKKLKKT